MSGQKPDAKNNLSRFACLMVHERLNVQFTQQTDPTTLILSFCFFIVVAQSGGLQVRWFQVI